MDIPLKAKRMNILEQFVNGIEYFDVIFVFLSNFI